MTRPKKDYMNLIKGLNESTSQITRKVKAPGRGNEDTIQISAHIPRSLFTTFNVKLAQLGKKKTEIIIELLQKWVDLQS